MSNATEAPELPKGDCGSFFAGVYRLRSGRLVDNRNHRRYERMREQMAEANRKASLPKT